MTRRLFALLALLSGLAALHAPAHASRLDSLSYDVQSLTQTAKAPGGAVCQCTPDERKRERSCPEKKLPDARPRLLVPLPPSLIIGADRALE